MTFLILVVKNLSATLEKMQPCHSLRFARGASHNLKSHSTKSGRYLSSHLANTTPAVKDVVHGKFISTLCDYSLDASRARAPAGRGFGHWRAFVSRHVTSFDVVHVIIRGQRSDFPANFELRVVIRLPASQLAFNGVSKVD